MKQTWSILSLPSEPGLVDGGHLQARFSRRRSPMHLVAHVIQCISMTKNTFDAFVLAV